MAFPQYDKSVSFGKSQLERALKVPSSSKTDILSTAIHYGEIGKSDKINLQSNNLMPHEANLKGIPSLRARDQSLSCERSRALCCLIDHEYENEKGLIGH